MIFQKFDVPIQGRVMAVRLESLFLETSVPSTPDDTPSTVFAVIGVGDREAIWADEYAGHIGDPFFYFPSIPGLLPRTFLASGGIPS
jgi:hypothetical protein